jgi:nucleoside-diphosphate-sugar epimerase
MRIFVAGATGVIGRRVVLAAIEDGNKTISIN